VERSSGTAAVVVLPGLLNGRRGPCGPCGGGLRRRIWRERGPGSGRTAPRNLLAPRMARGALKGSRADDHGAWVREGRLARITGETGSVRGKRIEPLLRVIPSSGVGSRRRKALVGWPVGLRRSGGPRRREGGLGEAGPAAGRRGARKKTTCRWARAVSRGARCAGGAVRGAGPWGRECAGPLRR